MALVEVKVPDIGDFKDVAIIELLVKPGDTVKAEQSLITVESDKASMEIPSSHSGVVKELKVALGDKVSEGSLLLMQGGGEAAAAPRPPAPSSRAAPATAARQPPLRPRLLAASTSSSPTLATSRSRGDRGAGQGRDTVKAEQSLMRSNQQGSMESVVACRGQGIASSSATKVSKGTLLAIVELRAAAASAPARRHARQLRRPRRLQPAHQ
jgi:pyruvate dehydrogenase E2 component (dihydrolipoamide acetyltransferase)